MELKAELTLRCEGTLIRGLPATYDSAVGWLPADGDEIRGFAIFVGECEVTTEVSSSEYDAAYEAYLEHLKGEDE